MSVFNRRIFVKAAVAVLAGLGFSKPKSRGDEQEFSTVTRFRCEVFGEDHKLTWNVEKFLGSVNADKMGDFDPGTLVFNDTDWIKGDSKLHEIIRRENGRRFLIFSHSTIPWDEMIDQNFKFRQFQEKDGIQSYGRYNQSDFPCQRNIFDNIEQIYCRSIAKPSGVRRKIDPAKLAAQIEAAHKSAWRHVFCT